MTLISDLHTTNLPSHGNVCVRTREANHWFSPTETEITADRSVNIKIC